MKKHKQQRKVDQAQKRAEYQKKKAKRALKKIKKEPQPTSRTSYRVRFAPRVVRASAVFGLPFF